MAFSQIGRMGEVANGCFVPLYFAESGFGWLSGLGKLDRRLWVELRQSMLDEVETNFGDCQSKFRVLHIKPPAHSD
jgi:hypothetical protein